MHYFQCPECGDDDLVRADPIEIWPDSSVLGWLPVTVAGEDGTTDIVVRQGAEITGDVSRRDGLAFVVSCLDGHLHVLLLRHDGGFGFDFEPVPEGQVVRLSPRRRAERWPGDPEELRGAEGLLLTDERLADQVFTSKVEAFSMGLHLARLVGNSEF